MASIGSVLLRFFRSVKLAVALILLIVVLSLAATLVPQGEVVRTSGGDRLGPYTIEGVSGRLMTGLTAVCDPGTLPVFIGLAMVGAGLVWTFIEKAKGRES